MRQVTFELLRHGERHNQLLSPLTQYLALCGNHAAVGVHVPFEHNQFLHRLGALNYQMGEEARVFQLQDTARVLGEMLACVPGLTAEMNRHDPNGAADDDAANGRQRLTHLRLIISASELALLPFELALTPNGFPGAGQYLLLQSQEPICLTREVRRVAEQPVSWPDKPRILFASASPPGFRQVPLEAHLLSLRRLIDPWLGYYDTDEERRERVAEHLVVLPNATADDLERECAEGQFSHVHILAHGVQYTDGYDERFGIALHDPSNSDKYDLVSGERLATILRPARPSGEVGLARPVAVTLASCYSGNVGTVMGMGGSVAHALHEAGIPIVIAGQFPISFPGSVLFVEVMYESLLWSEDPRLALNDLRRRLHSQLPATHDWASITAYAAISPDLERQFAERRIERVRRNINAAMNYADWTTRHVNPGKRTKLTTATTTPEKKNEMLEQARSKMRYAHHRLRRLCEGDRRARTCLLLASTEKRRAELLLAFSKVADPDKRAKDQHDSVMLLQKAQGHYWEAFMLDRSNAWAVVQYLSLDIVLNALRRPVDGMRPTPRDEHNEPTALWNLAHVISINETHAARQETRRWAFGNLTELYLLALLLPVLPAGVDPVDRATECARNLVDEAGADAFDVYSTRRQIARYDDWFSEISSIDAARPVVEAVLDVLPESGRQNWD